MKGRSPRMIMDLLKEFFQANTTSQTSSNQSDSSTTESQSGSRPNIGPWDMYGTRAPIDSPYPGRSQNQPVKEKEPQPIDSLLGKLRSRFLGKRLNPAQSKPNMKPFAMNQHAMNQQQRNMRQSVNPYGPQLQPQYRVHQSAQLGGQIQMPRQNQGVFNRRQNMPGTNFPIPHQMLGYPPHHRFPNRAVSRQPQRPWF